MPTMTKQKLSTVEPFAQKFLDMLAASNGPPIYTLSPVEARKVLENAAKVAPLNGSLVKKLVDIEEKVLSVGPTGQVRIYIFRPQGNKSQLPVVIYLHGGGWVLGSKDTHDRVIRDLVTGAQCAVVFVDYDRSPEAKFPVAIEQGYEVLKYIAENAREFNVDANRIAVVGDSVGGNLTAVVTLLAKERRGPKIVQQILFYPVTDANFNTGSYEQFAEDHFLTREGMKWFWNAYLPDTSARKKIIASPLQATVDQLKGLPPALITTNENDVLRDEGEAYAHKLAEAGVPVTSIRMVGAIHDNLILGALTLTPAPQAATALAVAQLVNVFNRG